MKNVSLLFAALLLTCSSASAQRSLFFPDKVNAPGYMDPMQVRTTLALKPSVNLSDFPEYHVGLNPSLDVAFSPVKHIVVAAGFRSLIGRVANDLSNFGIPTDRSEYSGYRYEGIVGYNTSFSGKGVVEAYIGYSNGYQRRSKGFVQANYDQWNWNQPAPDKYSTDFTSRFHTFSLQMAIGTESDNVSFRGGLKYTVQDFYSFSYKDKAMDTLLVNNPTTSEILNNSYAFIQPYIDLEAGGKRVRFSAQAGMSQQMVDLFSLEGDVRAYLSFGVAVKLGGITHPTKQ